MTFEQMRYFLSLAKTLSFTETAKQTYTTQPTISRQIKLLEEELGQPLFQRKGNSICLTSAGNMLRESLSRAASLIDESINLVKNNVSAYEGSLNVACSLSLRLEPFMVECYRQFSSRYPNVRFHYLKEPVLTMLEAVKTHSFDIILCHDSNAGMLRGLEKQRLFAHDGCLFYSKTLPQAQKEGLSPAGFSGMSIVCLNNESSPRGVKGIEKIARQVNLDYKSIITVPNLETAFFYVHAGLCVAILDTSVKELHHKAFETIPIPLESARMFTYAAWDSQNMNPAIRPFVNILKQRAAECPSPGDLYYS